MRDSEDGSKCHYTYSGMNQLNVIFCSDKHLIILQISPTRCTILLNIFISLRIEINIYIYIYIYVYFTSQ